MNKKYISNLVNLKEIKDDDYILFSNLKRTITLYRYIIELKEYADRFDKYLNPPLSL